MQVLVVERPDVGRLPAVNRPARPGPARDGLGDADFEQQFRSGGDRRRLANG
ncbi:hypothetical protein [Haloarcula regularis]|uniref:hypothetical protein n=1 Tax=Haloarcula regularis TaxID=3033392 RepID=UPI0023E7EEB7|nr:hypothetical protein [Halomicroarcula sp. SYNS111]